MCNLNQACLFIPLWQMNRKILALFSAVLTAVFGCEKAIDFNLEQAEERLVVEATIENGRAPVVVLSRSQNFFASISPELLDQAFVKGADVFVSDGNLTHKLKEFSVPAGGGYFLRYYTNDPDEPGTSIIGALKTAYTLRIVAEGKEYTASTTIPDTTRRIDSVWWKPVPNSTNDQEVQLYVRATDKPGFGDYIRYYTRKNEGTNNVNEVGVPIPGCTGRYCAQLPVGHFPTPFYETVVCTFLFFILWSVRKKIRPYGALFALYLILNGLERFFIEKIRVNNRMDLFGFHPTQAEVISTGLVLVGIALWLYLRKRTGSQASLL